MPEFDENHLKDLSIDEMNELFKDIIEIPEPLIGGVANVDCDTKVSYYAPY